MVTIDEVRKLRLVVARVCEAVEHPDADRLYVLQVETEGGRRQLVAGIRRTYDKEALVGRQIVMIENLRPAVIRGVESQGMLLAAMGPDGPVLLRPDRDVPVGAPVS